MGATSIQWTDRSINPIRCRNTRTGAVGHYCEKITSGCAHCYASGLQRRFAMPEFRGAGKPRQLPVGTANASDAIPIGEDLELFLDHGKLREVLSTRRPAKWFWEDMSDLFGWWVPDAWIDACIATMVLTPQHVHQVLTKRSGRLREYMIAADGRELKVDLPPRIERQPFDWPAPNIWMGVSAENQEQADQRIPDLLLTPAAVRFVSAEPLLGLIDIARSDGLALGQCARAGLSIDHGIDWVIIGGESGKHARTCDVAWIRALIAQCRIHGAAPFVKQVGSRPVSLVDPQPGDSDLHLGLRDRKGGDPAEWPEDLRVRTWPNGPIRPAAEVRA